MDIVETAIENLKKERKAVGTVKLGNIEVEVWVCLDYNPDTEKWEVNCDAVVSLGDISRSGFGGLRFDDYEEALKYYKEIIDKYRLKELSSL